MDETNTDAKQKELLPDILGHQERMRKRAAILEDSIKKLESEWSIDTNKTQLDPGPGPNPEPHDRQHSTVDSIYGGMSLLEGEFDSLGARLSLICGHYLGAGKN